MQKSFHRQNQKIRIILKNIFIVFKYEISGQRFRDKIQFCKNHDVLSSEKNELWL